jgi:hypothetical protein
MSGLLLEGDVYIDRFDDTGNSTGLVGPLNTTQFQINTPSESVDRTSKRKGTYGQSLDTVTLAQATEVAIVFDDQPADMIAMAMMGDTATVTQASGSVTETVVTLPSGNRWQSLAHTNLSDSGLTALLASDDSPVSAAALEVNYADGMIRTVPGGSLDTGTATAIKLSYSYAAANKTVISGGVKPTINARVLLKGRNLATGKPVECDIPKASLAPTQAVDLLSSEFVSTTLGGKAVLFDGNEAPFYLTTHE